MLIPLDKHGATYQYILNTLPTKDIPMGCICPACNEDDKTYLRFFHGEEYLICFDCYAISEHTERDESHESFFQCNKE